MTTHRSISGSADRRCQPERPEAVGLDWCYGSRFIDFGERQLAIKSTVDLPGIASFRLDGRTAIVTGGSKGLGLAMAAGLASAGANLMLVSRSENEAIAAAAAIMNQYPVDAIGLAADVADWRAVDSFVDTAIARWQKVDILINSAGINIRGPIDEVTPEQFEQVMTINVTGTWNVCRAVVPHMKLERYGRIINVASTLGVVGMADRTPYASSKGAVVQMTRTLGVELATHGITCNAICPGPFLTEMNRANAEDPEAMKGIMAAVPMDRWGQLEEIQGAALYLASASSSYTTGSLLPIDGGWTAH
jgi:NAD(P)-dependent dehydrogenase (short-subunit alcohol dehydrogenase family)